MSVPLRAGWVGSYCCLPDLGRDCGQVQDLRAPVRGLWNGVWRLCLDVCLYLTSPCMLGCTRGPPTCPTSHPCAPPAWPPAQVRCRGPHLDQGGGARPARAQRVWHHRAHLPAGRRGVRPQRGGLRAGEAWGSYLMSAGVSLWSQLRHARRRPMVLGPYICWVA